MWCTNRLDNSSEDSPTYGMLNQIGACWGVVTPPNWNGFLFEGPAGFDRRQAIDFFRAQFGLGPIYDPGTTYYRSNVFLAPFSPVRTIQLHTSWQANDPLVHHTLSQLIDLRRTNNIDFFGQGSTIGDLGRINSRYDPWGGNPYGGGLQTARYDLSLKDSLVTRPDSWDFPTGQPLSPNWLGGVHRGTPWQTLYLKSPVVEAGRWQTWVGVSDPNQAALMQPSSDWRLVSLLAPLFNNNGPGGLISANETNIAVWTSALDGISVLTNTSTDQALQSPWSLPQFGQLVMGSNSPQAAMIAAAIVGVRSGQPEQQFHLLGEILTAPELTVDSPWLDTNGVYILARGITERAYEAIPAQLLSRLRPDSFGLVFRTGGTTQIQFSGFDGYRYAVQSSSNLRDWIWRATYSPQNGRFDFFDSAPPTPASRFFRTVLLID